MIVFEKINKLAFYNNFFLDGSRTPYYGSMTPAYEGGGRTPSHNSSWDPAVVNTPARFSHNDFNDGFGASSKFGATPVRFNNSFNNQGFSGIF